MDKKKLNNLRENLIIKSLIVPIFTYMASACVVPEKYRKEIDLFGIINLIK